MAVVMRAVGDGRDSDQWVSYLQDHPDSPYQMHFSVGERRFRHVFESHWLAVEALMRATSVGIWAITELDGTEIERVEITGAESDRRVAIQRRKLNQALWEATFGK